MAETPEQKYNRIAEAVQKTILTNFPNPNRVGCPGAVRVREVATRRSIVEDDDWQHITHCSECYREFLEAKDAIRRSGRRARTLGLIGGTALLIIAAAVGGYRYFAETNASSGTVAMSYAPATLNLRDTSEVRGDGKDVQREIPTMPRRALELTVILPFGSEPGAYEFEFADASGRVINHGRANAVIRNGNTVLTIRVDLSNITAGGFQFGWRREPFNWVRTQVKVN